MNQLDIASLEHLFPAAPAHSAEWAPLLWEPVMGTEERLMVGVVARCGEQWTAVRVVREDVFTAIYGKKGAGAKAMVDLAIDMLRARLPLQSWYQVTLPISGFHLGAQRDAAGDTVSGIVRQAVAMAASLSRPDIIDEIEAEDTPGASESVNRQWATKIRDAAANENPEVIRYFNQALKFYDDGEQIKFGFCNDRLAMHFGLLRVSSLSSSIKDARARLWELRMARSLAHRSAGLLIGVPHNDDVTLSDRQRDSVIRNVAELEREAEEGEVTLLPVTTPEDGARELIRLAA